MLFSDIKLLKEDEQPLEFEYYDEIVTSENFGFSEFKQTKLRNNNLMYANFLEAKVIDCIFENNKLIDSYFVDVKIDQKSREPKTKFSENDFTKTNFTGTMLKGIDLSNSIIDEIVISQSLVEIRGAKISMIQMLGLTHLLQIEIVE